MAVAREGGNASGVTVFQDPVVFVKKTAMEKQLPKHWQREASRFGKQKQRMGSVFRFPFFDRAHYLPIPRFHLKNREPRMLHAVLKPLH